MMLTNKQKMFCEEYLLDLCATQAAIRAGYSKKTAYTIGWENLRKPEVAEYLQKLMRERTQKVGITAEGVLDELGKVGFCDVRDLFDESGKIRPPQDLDEATAAAIGSVKYGEDCRVTGYKAESKLRALELLGRYLGMWEKDEKKLPRVTVVLSEKDQRL